MPERNDLDYQFEDEETEYDLDDEEAEGYDDDEEYEDDEDGDEEYDEYDDEEAPQGGGWKKTAIFAIVGLMVAGAGAYYFMSDGNLPFLAKKDPVPGASPFANPGGFGKVAKAPEADPAQPAQVPPTPVAVAPENEAPKPVEAEAPQPVAPAVPVVAKPAATPKPVAKPVAKTAPAKVPAAKPAAKPAESRPAKAAALQGRRYAVQVGSFADASNANNLLAALKAKGYSEAYLDNGGAITGAYAVRSTVVDSSAKANELKSQFAAAGHPGSVVSVGKGKYAIQLGIYSSRGSAQNLASELNDQGLFVSVASGATKRVGATRVRVGNFDSLAGATQLATQLRSEGVPAIAVKR